MAQLQEHLDKGLIKKKESAGSLCVCMCRDIERERRRKLFPLNKQQGFNKLKCSRAEIKCMK
ncbi:hypothetical protein HanXRQr2_Chr14g0623501 [Helianthus annuus]|uniref:Uncharacterized protein n=1 Tax=Helianthus annuus TaxID=4232 RepID=A0A9K3H5Q7_HELAN|nr:hypothetical protein HanXRQr2_Chr14g0623501 [Helianthus annuus]KAJ0466669.1 hypothetical protein HanIR_Chr14g0674751 [Helianthus annuus]KAJ0838737.1 hypothetical protein HanPSC8_Chr14g0598331 [Helianthus annuus]